MIRQQVDHYLDEFLAKDYGAATFSEWAGKQLAMEFDPRDFRGMDFDGAQQFAKDEAQRMVEGQVLDLIEENLPQEEDPGEWSWEALTKAANVRWKLSLRDRDLRQLGRDQASEDLIQRARAAVQKIDLEDGRRFLDPNFGIRTACAWVRQQVRHRIGARRRRRHGTAGLQGSCPAKSRGGLRGKGTRISGDGRAGPFYHPRRRRA